MSGQQRCQMVHVWAVVCLVAALAIGSFVWSAKANGVSTPSEDAARRVVPADPDERQYYYEMKVEAKDTGDLNLWTEIALLGLGDDNPAVCWHAIRILHRFDDTREGDVVTALGRRLRDTSEKRGVKFEVLMELGNMNSPRIMDYWIELKAAFLEGEGESDQVEFPATDSNYRTEAAKVLMGVGGVEHALPLFESTRNPAATFGAMQALYGIGSATRRQFGTDETGVARVRAYVVNHVNDEDADVRKVAVQALQYVWLRESSDAAKEDIETNVRIRQLLEARLAKETDKVLAEMIQGILSPSSLTPTLTAGTLEPHVRSAASSRCIPCGK